MKTKSKLARVLLYLGKLTVILALSAALLIFVFVASSRFSNVFIIVNDGLKVRAAEIMQTETDDLIEYFSQDFLERDAALFGNPYADFTITNYDYNIKIEKINVLPWSKQATVRIAENMGRIRGEINELAKEENGNEGNFSLPAWQNKRYNVVLTYNAQQGRWYISDMIELELIDDETAENATAINITENELMEIDND